MINEAALDRAVRKCPLLLEMARRKGVNDRVVRWDAEVLLPLIIQYYREECAR